MRGNASAKNLSRKQLLIQKLSSKSLPRQGFCREYEYKHEYLVDLNLPSLLLAHSNRLHNLPVLCPSFDAASVSLIFTGATITSPLEVSSIRRHT